MRRIISMLLALAVIAAFLPAAVPGADAAVLTEPTVEIKDNRLYYNGRTIDMLTCLQTFKILYLARADRRKVTKQMLDTSPDLPPIAYEVNINPDNVQDARRPSLTPQTLSEGDALYFAVKPKDGGDYSPFKEIVLTEEMFAMTTTPSASLLPALSITGNKLTIIPKSRLTKYEYAIIPNDAPAGFYPDWVQVGSAAAWGGDSITVPIRPCSYAHTVRVRVVNDSGPYYAAAAGVPQTAPGLSIELELIGPLAGGSGGCYWYLSANGGKKYQKLYVAAGQDGYFDLNKIFGKNQVDLVLKKSQEDVNPEEISASALSATVNPRAELSKEYKINPFVSAQYPENWTLYGLDGSARLEYRVQGSKSWAPFPSQTGLPLLLESDQALKKKAQKLEFRVAANPSSMTPASAVKRITQPKQVKAPKIKLDYKNETVKLKEGMLYAFADSYYEEFDRLSFSQSSGTVDIAGAISNGQTIYVYTPETDKKSRSAVFKATPAQRGETPDSDDGLVLQKGKAKLIKGYEVFGSNGKWGSLPKGDTEVRVRRKATAKYNAKTGMTAGEAASLPITAWIEYSGDGKTVAEITADEKDDLVPTAIYMSAGSNCSIYGRRTFGIDVLQEDVFDYEVYMETVKNTLGDLRTCSFSVTVMEPRYVDGKCPAKGITFEKNGKLVYEDVWGSDITGAKVGDVFTFRLLPVDRNTYRETVYRITVVPPVLSAPGKISWGAEPDRGTAEITLPGALSPGNSVKLRVSLIKYVNDEDKVISDSTRTFTNTEYTSDMKTVSVNFSKEIAASGVGRYYVRAFCVGSPGVSQDSYAAGSSYLSVYSENLALSYVALSSDMPLQKDAVAKIDRTTDGLGNSLACSVQWVTSDTKPSQSDTGTAIAQATSRAFTVPDGLEGKYLGVRATQGGKLIMKWFDDPIIAD